MSEAPNPRVALGGNFPPLDPAERLDARLEADHAALAQEAARLELEALDLPQQPGDDAACGVLADFVVRAKAVGRRLEDARKEAKAPYLAGTRKIDEWFGELTAIPLGLAERVVPRITAYNRAKEARERAEAQARAAEQQRIALEAEAAAQRQRDEAAAAQRRADEAAAAVRRAETTEARNAAAAQLQEAEASAQTARKAADSHETTAVQAERRAEQQERRASGAVALGRTATAGATTSVTKEWRGQIVDAEALLASLGPLGPYFSNTEVTDAVARAVRQAASGGHAAALVLPGVRVVEDVRTNIRAR